MFHINVDSSKSLEQSNFLVQVEVSSMTLKTGVFLLLNNDNQVSIFYPLVWDLMALSTQSDFFSVGVKWVLVFNTLGIVMKETAIEFV